MAQFDVHRLANGQLVLDLQSDFIDIGTRIVAPLMPPDQSPTPLPRLEPVVTVEGASLVLHIAEMAAIPERLLSGPRIAHLGEQGYEIRGALDMVFTGF